jgi:hypothetical protein
MNLAHLPPRIANYLALALALAMVGCGESPDMRDQRLAEFARQSMAEQQKQNDRIADQSKAVVDESHQLAQAAKELVTLDAQARRELLAAQSDLASQLAQQQSVVDAKRDELEQERREIAGKRNRDPIIASAIQYTGLILGCLAPLGICAFVIRQMQAQEPDHAAVADLLIQELAKPKLLPGPKLPPKELEGDTEWMGSIESDDDDMHYETSPTKGSKYA